MVSGYTGNGCIVADLVLMHAVKPHLEKTFLLFKLYRRTSDAKEARYLAHC